MFPQCPSTDRLSALLEGGLPDAQLAELTAHLDSCNACQQNLERLASGQPDPPDAAQAGLVTATVPDQGRPVGGRSVMPPTGHDVPLLGRKIGHYRIRSVIGSGGMGHVYLAVQERPHRTVAFKMMKQGIASRSALRRFEYEAQILARLRHPGIAQIYEAGTHHDELSGPGPGVPYFAMEYVPNARSIIQYATDNKITIRQRLELFAKVCDAVHHGHQKGIIHRDLKPSNILVDSAGQPKIIDFGVARATDSDLAVTTLQTDIGQLIGTLQYMSPEQYDADPTDLDTRSDVYALGVLLYELLCQKLPYDVTKVSVYQAAQVIRDANPPRLSRIDRTLRGDLETIVQMALEKQRDRRYQSAADLARDLRRYLRHEPIEARPPSIAYHLGKFSQRHRVAVIGAVAVLATLLVGIVATTWQARRATKAERHTSKKYEQLIASKDVMIQQNRQSDRLLYRLGISGARDAMFRDANRMAGEHLNRLPPELLDWRYQRMQWMVQSQSSVGDGSVAVVPPTGAMHLAPGINAMAVAVGGRELLSGGFDGVLRLWRLPDQVPRIEIVGHESGISSVGFSTDGTTVVSGSFDHTLRIWDRKTGQLLHTLAGHQAAITCMAIGPYGQWIISGGDDNKIGRWEVSSSQEVKMAIAPDEGVSCLAFDPLGKRFISGSYEGTVTLWDTQSLKVLLTMVGHEGSVSAVLVIGDQIISAGADGTIRLWDIGSGQLNRSVPIGSSITAMELSPERQWVGLGTLDGNVGLWDPIQAVVRWRPRGESIRGVGPQSITALAWLAAGQGVLWNRLDGWNCRWAGGDHDAMLDSGATVTTPDR